MAKVEFRVANRDTGGVVSIRMEVESSPAPQVGEGIRTSIVDVVAVATGIASKYAAQTARKRMAGWLDPKSQTSVGIGWSGKSARSLSVMEASTDGTYTVRERRRSLWAIRHGLKPGARGPHQRDTVLRKWAAEHFKYQGRERKNEAAEAEAAFQTLKSAIRRDRTSVGWESLPQVGRRYFNYPQRYKDDYAAADMESVMHKLLQGEGPKSFQGLVKQATLAVLSSARLGEDGQDSVNVGNLYLGSKGRQKSLWQQVEKNFLGTTEEHEKSYAGTADDTVEWNYAKRVRRKLGFDSRKKKVVVKPVEVKDWKTRIKEKYGRKWDKA